MEGEQFSLCWNNFHSNLSSGFHSLLKEENLVDVTLAAEGKFLKAHKTVLSVCSPFFKELFRVNPCKHPIVILPEVNYGALCSLLHFMYNGEVSVSQEEIPTFMRVAETLKVKGLTDNTETNGFTQTKNYNNSSTSQIMKRPRPAKKLIKPIQHLRPIVDTTPPLKSPSSSANAKRPYLDDSSSSSNIVKKEPSFDDDNTNQSDETSMDAAHMLDTTLDEPGASNSFTNWTAQEFAIPPQDTSSPVLAGTASPSLTTTTGTGGLMLLKSGRGQLVLIHNGHIYTMSDQREGRNIWVCVKKKTLNCEGRVTTLHGPVLLSYSGHNHSQMHDVIQRLQVTSCSISPELM